MSTSSNLETRGRIGAVVERLPNTIWLPTLITLAVSVLFVGVRLEHAAHGDVSRFVVAGKAWVNPSCSPKGLAVVDGAGYDGQFYYRLALDPLDLRPASHCIYLDTALRRERIAYPAVTWLVSGGQEKAVPWALVLVNIAALTALAALGGMLARDAGRHVVWGLGLALFFGFVYSMSRDLGEVFEGAALIAGLVAVRRRHFVLAAVGLSFAVLAREAAMAFVLSYGLLRLVALVRRQVRAGIEDLPWIAPLVVFAAWQLVCLGAGPSPLGHSGGDSVRFPGNDLVRAFPHYVDRIGTGSGVLQVAEAATLLMVMALALLSVRNTTAPPWERLALVVFVVFALCLSTPVGVWTEQFDFRLFSDTFLLAWVVLLGARMRLLVPISAVFLCWLGAIGLRIGTV